MRIVDENLHPFFIECDENNFILREFCTVETGENAGKIYEVTHGYYVDLGWLLRKLSTLILARQNKDVSLQEYIQEYKTVSSKILNVHDTISENRKS